MNDVTMSTDARQQRQPRGQREERLGRSNRVTIVERKRDTETETETETETHFSACEHASVYLTTSLCMLILAAVSYITAVSSTNWSASGQFIKMGIWDYCTSRKGVTDVTWNCYPINADFSVATQVFGILAIVCFVCGFLFYLLQAIFHSLRQSRSLVIGMSATAFCIATLQLMMMIVYALKHGGHYRKITQEQFTDTGIPSELFLSWGFYFTAVSTLFATLAGVLLFVEFRNLTYRFIYGGHDSC